MKGSGFVSGDVITDNVVLAGLTLNAHTFGVSSVESDDVSVEFLFLSFQYVFFVDEMC